MIITKSEPLSKEEKERMRQLIGALAMDLKRVALGLHRGSHTMAKRFIEEALKREEELEREDLDQYLKKLIIDTRKCLSEEATRTAEDALMYSTLFQNYALKKFH